MFLGLYACLTVVPFSLHFIQCKLDSVTIWNNPFYILLSLYGSICTFKLLPICYILTLFHWYNPSLLWLNWQKTQFWPFSFVFGKYRVFIWNLGKLTIYHRGFYSIIWAKTWGKSLVFIGHFSRFRHKRNIKDIYGSNWPFLTASPKEKNKQNSLFQHPILRSKFSVCSTFTMFSSYGLIFCMLNNDLLNSDSL